jgi:GT2 family glycosyltransferase
MPSHEPRVAVIILNTNKREDTLACLASLAESTWQNLDVIVLDNASTDGSVAAIRERHPSVHLEPLRNNRGYAGNNNVGVALALARGADWLFVLNEDTILDPLCIEELVRYGQAHPKVGIAGPLVFHFDEPGVIQSAGGWFDSWQAGHIGQNEDDRGQFAAPRRVAWISGCGIMLRSAVIEQVGMLDERFFYYWEETDWCLRAQRADWQCALVPGARLWHKGVVRDYVPSPNVSYYNTRNRLLMMRKHGASTPRLALEIFGICRMLTAWAIRPKWRSQREHRRAVIQALGDFVRQRWGQRPELGARG